MEELRARFEANVEQGEPDACWPWTGTIRRKGYGQLSHQRRAILAHRLAWELAHGPIPEGLQVCHRCDNPPCCNPAHLFLGTAADNQRDKRQKGRAARGEANGGGRKLTELHDHRSAPRWRRFDARQPRSIRHHHRHHLRLPRHQRTHQARHRP